MRVQDSLPAFTVQEWIDSVREYTIRERLIVSNGGREFNQPEATIFLRSPRCSNAREFEPIMITQIFERPMRSSQAFQSQERARQPGTSSDQSVKIARRQEHAQSPQQRLAA